jgi:hypothetical protein
VPVKFQIHEADEYARELSLSGFCLSFCTLVHQGGFWMMLMRECVGMGGGIYRFRGKESCGNM